MDICDCPVATDDATSSGDSAAGAEIIDIKSAGR